MIWLAAGAAALLLLLALARGFATASVSTVKVALAWGLGAAGAALFGLLLFTGRGASALWALVMFGPALRQLWSRWKTRRVFSRPAEGGGEASGVETATLEMRLDLATGLMSGRVRQGPYAGQELADLDLRDLRALLAGCARDDPESVPLLEAWLDRAHPTWRAGFDGGGAAPEGGDGRMSREEALAILGLAEGATAEEVRAAHRRLMRAAHPDQGGSDWLAARLNAAREFLLRG